MCVLHSWVTTESGLPVCKMPQSQVQSSIISYIFFFAFHMLKTLIFIYQVLNKQKSHCTRGPWNKICVDYLQKLDPTISPFSVTNSQSFQTSGYTKFNKNEHYIWHTHNT
jgi:hypothetical protein